MQVSPIIQQKNIHQPQFTAMKKSQFHGADLLAVETFKIPIQDFYEMADFKRWINAKAFHIMNLLNYKHSNPVFNKERTLRLFHWKQYLTKLNPLYIASPALALVIFHSISKHLKSENTEMPPLFNAGALGKTTEELQNLMATEKKTQFNFLKHYVENLRQIEATASAKIEDKPVLDYNSGWIIIPSASHCPQNFRQNVERLKSLSHPNWCTSSTNAEPYLSKGDFHIYFDKGRPRVGVRFEDDVIVEIQGVQNNGNIPVEYLEQIETHIKENNLNVTSDIMEKIDNESICRKLKPICEKLMAENDVEGLFKLANIEFERLENGTYKLYNYHSDINNVPLRRLGVNEKLLLENVSEISGDADFGKSALRVIPASLEKISGNLLLNTSIAHLGSIKYVGGNLGFIEAIEHAERSLHNASNLQYVGGNCDLENTRIRVLDNLARVEGNLNIQCSEIEVASKLKYVGGDLILNNSEIKFMPALEKVKGKIEAWNVDGIELPELKSAKLIDTCNRNYLDFARFKNKIRIVTELD